MPAKRKPPAQRPPKQRMTSIRLDPAIVEILQERAEALGVGWQTVLKMIVTRYAKSEL